jgi:F1F0 ATPase subunit 2
VDAPELAGGAVSEAPLLYGLLGLAAGLALGLAQFLSLAWNTRLYTERGGAGRAVAAQVLRLAILAAGFAALAQAGAEALLFGLLGLLLARRLVLRRSGGL